MNHVPIRLNTLRPDDVINFDVYIKVGDRLILYIRNSEPFESDRLEKLRTKGVKKLFIELESEPLYINYLDKGLDRLQNDSLSKDQKVNFVKDTMTTEAENAVRNVETKEGYIQTEKRMDKLVKFLTSESGALKSIMDSSGYAMDGFQHCANVATLSLSLANICGYNKPKELLELGLAALLHDIGKAELGLDPHAYRENLIEEDKRKWDKHPDTGATMLADKPHISKSILEMIMYHEEKGDCIGPHKKKISVLPLGTQILSLCNEYDRIATVKQIPPKEVIKSFLQEKIGLFDLKHITALSGLLK